MSAATESKIIILLIRGVLLTVKIWEEDHQKQLTLCLQSGKLFCWMRN